MTGFSNPVTNASNALIRASVHSPNYVLNVTGWSIKKDGTAQFTGIVLIGGTFTGTNFIINSSGSFFYSGAPALGNMILSSASSSGVDAFGNAFPQGFAAYTTVQPKLAAIGLNVLGNFGLFFQDTSSAPYTGPSISSPQANAAGTEIFIDSGLGLIRPNDADANISISSQLKSAITGGAIICAAGRVQFGGAGQAYWDDNAGQLSLAAGTGPFIAGEGFHTIALPSAGGFSGSVRVKKLPWNMICLDVAIQWTNTTNASFTGGSLPDASYYPINNRWFPLAHGGAQTTDNDAVIEIPISGGIVITTNASSGGSGTAAQSGITVTYPTN